MHLHIENEGKNPEILWAKEEYLRWMQTQDGYYAWEFENIATTRMMQLMSILCIMDTVWFAELLLLLGHI